jgi:LmbE family N-acetylglucosaminyl deacetylase
MATILAIHAHPDDLEILAGGTLALLAGKGSQIAMITMTSGDCGSAQHSAEEIAAIRYAEAAHSASLIGAHFECAGFSDMAIFSDDASRRLVTELLRRTRPNLVITASPIDYMPDHEATSALVRDACFASSVPLYRTGVGDAAPALPAIPHLYFTDPIEGIDREGRRILPDFCVDITSVLDLKRRMLGCHASQRAWLARQHGIDDYLERMESVARSCGLPWGVSSGEGFRRYRGHPYPQAPLLESLLGANAVSETQDQNLPGRSTSTGSNPATSSASRQ